MKKVQIAFISILFGALSVGALSLEKTYQHADASAVPYENNYSLNDNIHWINWAGATFSGGKMHANSSSSGAFNWRSLGIDNLNHVDVTIDENLTLNAMGDWKFETLSFTTLNPGTNPSIDGGTGDLTGQSLVTFEWGWTTGFCIIENDNAGNQIYKKSLGTTEGTHPFTNKKPTGSETDDANILQTTPYNLFDKPVSYSIDLTRDNEGGIVFTFDLVTKSQWGHDVEYEFSYRSANTYLVNGPISICYDRVGSSGDFDGGTHYITADISVITDQYTGNMWSSLNGYSSDGSLIHATSMGNDAYAVSKPLKGTVSTLLDVDYTLVNSPIGSFAVLFSGTQDDYNLATLSYGSGGTTLTATGGNFFALVVDNAKIVVYECNNGAVSSLGTNANFTDPVDGTTMDGNSYWYSIAQLNRVYITTSETTTGKFATIQFVSKNNASSPIGKDYTFSFSSLNANLLGNQEFKLVNVSTDAVSPTAANNSASLKVANYPVTATFMSDGNVYESNNFSYGTNISAPTVDPSKTGCTFLGWYDSEIGGNKITSFPEANVDVTYYAHFNGSVTWVVDSDVILTGEYTEGATALGTVIVAPTSATKPGTAQYTYTFDGWYDQPTGGNKITNFGTVTGANVFYGRFNSTVNQYAVNWVVDGDVVLTGDYTHGNVDYGTVIIAPTSATKPSTPQHTYSFDGWYDQPTGGNKITDFGTVTGATNFYGRFNADVKQYTVTWVIDEDVTLTGDYTHGDVDYGTTIVAPSSATKDPTAQYTYTFDGWYDQPTGGNKITDFGTVNSDVAFYSRFNSTVNEYTVSWVVDGDVILTGEYTEGNVEYGTQIIAPYSATKPGTAQYTYTFDGWYDQPTGGNKITNFGTVTGATNFYGRFNSTVNQYQVNWVVDNDVILSGEYTHGNVDYGTAIVAPTSATKPGTAQYTYTFDGWYDQPTGGNKITDFGNVTEPTTFYGRFNQTTNQYAVNWVVDSDVTLTGEYTEGNVDYGTVIIAPTSATKPSTPQHIYTFDGWYDQPTGGNKITDFGTVTGATNFYGRFNSETLSCTISWHYSSDVIVEGTYTEGEVDYGTVIIAPTSVTKPADDYSTYTFDGWYDQPTGGNKITDFGVADEDKDYYARFIDTDRKYVITFIVEEETYSSSSLGYDEQIEKPSVDPVKKEDVVATYIFEGWYTASEGGNKIPVFPKVTGKATYYAHFSATAKKYTAYFVVGNDIFSSVNIEYGQQIVPPATIPTKAPTDEVTYIFNGWYTAKTGGSKVTDFPVITKDVTYFAQFTSVKRTYTVSFNSDGGTLINSQEIEYGDYVTIPEENPTKDGYSFDGWYLEDELFDFENTAVEENIELQAHWKKVEKSNAGIIGLFVGVGVAAAFAIASITLLVIKSVHKKGTSIKNGHPQFKKIKMKKKYSSGPIVK